MATRYALTLWRDRLLGSDRFRGLTGRERGAYLTSLCLLAKADPRSPLRGCLCVGDTPMTLEEWAREVGEARRENARLLRDRLLELGLFEFHTHGDRRYLRVARFADNQDRPRFGRFAPNARRAGVKDGGEPEAPAPASPPVPSTPSDPVPPRSPAGLEAATHDTPTTNERQSSADPIVSPQGVTRSTCDTVQGSTPILPLPPQPPDPFEAARAVLDRPPEGPPKYGAPLTPQIRDWLAYQLDTALAFDDRGPSRFGPWVRALGDTEPGVRTLLAHIRALARLPERPPHRRHRPHLEAAEALETSLRAACKRLKVPSP